MTSFRTVDLIASTAPLGTIDFVNASQSGRCHIAFDVNNLLEGAPRKVNIQISRDDAVRLRDGLTRAVDLLFQAQRNDIRAECEAVEVERDRFKGVIEQMMLAIEEGNAQANAPPDVQVKQRNLQLSRKTELDFPNESPSE